MENHDPLEMLSDKELIKTMNNGQKERAFNVIYKRHNEPLYLFCLNSCCNENLARELVSDTFIKFFKKSETFVDMPNSSFKSWLYRIAVNSMFDYYRSKKRLENVVSTSDLTYFNEDHRNFYGPTLDLPSEDENPERKLEIEERNKILYNKLSSLGEEFKWPAAEIIISRYYEGLSYDEISREFRIPLGSVKTLLFRAKGLLKDKLLKYKDFFLYD